MNFTSTLARGSAIGPSECIAEGTLFEVSIGEGANKVQHDVENLEIRFHQQNIDNINSNKR
jgi:hypothetical protein